MQGWHTLHITPTKRLVKTYALKNCPGALELYASGEVLIDGVLWTSHEELCGIANTQCDYVALPWARSGPTMHYVGRTDLAAVLDDMEQQLALEALA